MSDTRPDELEEIRERKRERLLAAAETPDEPIHVEGRDHLDELIADNELLLVDFHADWCGPCKMLAPTVETIAAETDAAVAKVDIDAHQGLAQAFDVQGVPTLLFWADGELADRLVGVQDDGTLRDLIATHG